MTFYIARRNKDTDNFELIIDGNNHRPKEYHSKPDAIEQYQLDIEWEGRNNVMLLETTALKVDIKVEERVD